MVCGILYNVHISIYHNLSILPHVVLKQHWAKALIFSIFPTLWNHMCSFHFHYNDVWHFNVTYPFWKGWGHVDILRIFWNAFPLAKIFVFRWVTCYQIHGSSLYSLFTCLTLSSIWKKGIPTLKLMQSYYYVYCYDSIVCLGILIVGKLPLS